MRSAAVGLALLLGACAPPPAARSGPAASEAKRQDQARKLPGRYTCSFELGEAPVDGASCDIRRLEGGELGLEARGSEKSLRGTLSPTDYGFQFTGTYLCGGEDGCEEEVRTDFFEAEEEGLYSGVVELLEAERLLTITLRRD